MRLLTGQSKTIDNYFSIKKYNDNYYKLTIFKHAISNCSNSKKVKGTHKEYDEKLDFSVSRSRSKVFEYAMCNEFEYFITITLDKKKVKSRHDLDTYIKDLGQFIRNERRRTGSDIQYVLVPEEHKDGAWHMHGLVKGINPSDLKDFREYEVIDEKILKLLNEGHMLYNWLGYANKFGFNSVEKIRDTERVSKYIIKYISKELSETQRKRKHKKLYYCSRGLKVSEKLKEGSWSAKTKLPSQGFENEYVQILDLTHDEYMQLVEQLYHTHDMRTMCV